MIKFFVEMFSWPFMQRAFIAGCMLALCAALLGVNLVLKRYSMIGDGLSHVGFGALALATTIGLPSLYALTASIPIIIIAAFVLLSLGESKILKGDSAIALISTSTLAFGYLVISLGGGVNTDVCNYMFGSVTTISQSEFIFCISLCIPVLLVYLLFFNKIFAITFDENFARATGVASTAYNVIIAALTAMTIVIGMKIVGALLISALIIFPPLSAMQVFKKYKSVVAFSAVISVVCFFGGLCAAWGLSTPVGSSVVMINLLVFAVCALFAKIRNAVYTGGQK